MGLDQHQLQEAFADSVSLERFANLYSLSGLWRTCILADDYVAPDVLDQLIVLTVDGTDLEASASLTGCPPAEKKLAIFGLFGLARLFVDLDRTDIDAVAATLSAEISAGRVRYPFILGRSLYDEYFDGFPHSPRVLSYAETSKLLNKTGTGVCQMRRYLTGPFGLVVSDSERLLPPLLRVPLTHCSDPACDELHPVMFRTGDSGLSKTFKKVNTAASEQATESPSEWMAFWVRRLLFGNQWADFNCRDLAVLLGNALGESELPLVLANLWRGVDDRREDLGLPGAEAPETTAEGLPLPALLQATLMFSDEEICACLDRLIYRGTLSLRSGEVRRSPRHFGYSGMWNQIAETSMFGVRFTGPRELPMLRLRKLLMSLAADPGAAADLEWQLVDEPGSSVEEKLDQALRTRPIPTVLTELVLSRRKGFQLLTDYLAYGDLPEPTDDASRRYLASAALWKLGFEPAADSAPLRAFWECQEELERFVADHSHLGPNEQGIVRGIAVNMFVHLENILNSALAFSYWALTTDHVAMPPNESFVYNSDTAWANIRVVLEGHRMSDGSTLSFGGEGGATLFGLLAGLSIMRKLLDETTADDCQRPDALKPRWALLDTARTFAFAHSMPWWDLSEDSRTQTREVLASVARSASEGGILAVRNRVPHGGGDFPQPPAWSECLRSCSAIVSELELSGLVPLEFALHARLDDAHGREVHVYRDYREREVTLRLPTPAAGFRTPPLGSKQLILRSATLAVDEVPLRFVQAYSSEFSRMWAGYPRRRGLPSGSEEGMLAAGVARELDAD